MILHHYPLSPYSEKIRALLAYSESTWLSCLTREAPPRGKLDLLSGGYSRIPIAQDGADIFCDSNIIADEIAQRASLPFLANATLQTADAEFRHWIETRLFFACVNHAIGPGFLFRIGKEKGIVNLLGFLKDRIGMAAKASIPMGSPKSATRHIRTAMDEITRRLNQQNRACPYMAGEQPGILDFAAYHCFWFVIEAGEKNVLEAKPSLLDWYQRMRAFSRPAGDEITIDQAIAHAQRAEPRTLEPDLSNDPRIGSEVTIAPNDYRQIPVTGKLVGANGQRWVLALEQTQTGVIHLHFPAHCVDVKIRLSKY